jgi:hypothetical protein
MTTERAHAYVSVLAFLEGPTVLQTTECDLVRSAADALLFASAPDLETSEAVSEARALAHSLVDSGRCRAETAAGLLAALRACGPDGIPADMASLRDQRFARHPLWSRVGR